MSCQAWKLPSCVETVCGCCLLPFYACYLGGERIKRHHDKKKSSSRDGSLVFRDFDGETSSENGD
jgi:hypothetical protein